MKRIVSTGVVSLALVLPAQSAAQADCSELVINAVDRGWYDATGHHSPGNNNYYAGDGVDGPSRNWFVFPIPVLTQQISSVSLRINAFQLYITDSETYQLRHVSTPVPTLSAGGSGLTSIYADLADGAIYGSRAFFPSNSYQVISIPLNDVFRSNMAAAGGTDIAIGGEVSTMDGISGNEERLFGFSGGDWGDVQLVITLPSSTSLAITTQPQSQTHLAGQNSYLSVLACGSSSLSYQWQLNGTDVAGANSSSLELFNVSSNEAGAYRVVVSNSSGSVTSDVATVTVDYQVPTVTAYLPAGTATVYTGESFTLCASANGAPPPTLQWQFNGTNLPGAINPCLTRVNLHTNHSGNYQVVASNAAGVVTSAVVSVVVTTRPPVVAYFLYAPPPIAIGAYAYMCAEVHIPGPFPAFQWQFNGTNLPVETNQCLYIQTLNTSHAGFYTIIASNSSGVYTSAPIELTVFFQPPGTPYLYFSLGNNSALEGNDVTICSSYGGSPPLAFQWRFNGVDLPGENASCLSLLQVSTNQAGDYSLVVSNAMGMATGSVATLTVSSQAPIFVLHPSNQSVVEGATIRLWSYASAGPPAEHVLQFNGTNLPVPFSYEGSGGFTLLDVTTADAGQYQVIASNSFGVATSVVATLEVTPAGPLDRWTQRNPLPQSQWLFSVAYGNGLFVAVGDRGTVLTSADGTNWFLQNRRVDLPLLGVTYGNGLFVAVGSGGTVLVSADGTNWVYRFSAPSTDLNAVTYGNGRFIAVGDGPGQTFVVTSTNGVTWDRVAVPGVSAARSVVFGNGLFVAVGSSAIITSSDGFDWSVAQNGLSMVLESVSFLQNHFIAVGNGGSMFISSDGTSWGARNSGTTRRLLGVAYGNGNYVAAGVRGTVLTSSDASTWTAAASETPDRLETILFANGLFIAAGENGTIISSTDGTSWGKQNFGVTRDLDGIALANGTIVIVGKGGSILTSTNGTHYAQQDAGVTNDLHGIAWGGGLWVAVGEPGVILTSSNAIQWTAQASGNTNSLKGATYGDGKWIVVGTQGSVITSSDGVNWSPAVTSPPFDLNDVAYGNGLFVIAGDGAGNQNGSAFVSSNGVTWAWINSFSFNKNLRSVFFTNGFFFATGNDGFVFSSTNGLNWQVTYTRVFSNLRDATLAQGLWTVVGNRGTIVTSSNRMNWISRPTRTFENLHGVVYLNGRFVAIGNRGTVLQSGRFITELETPRYEPAVGALVGVNGVLGQAYRLEISNDLRQWTDSIRFTNATERTVVTDTNALTQPQRFYRLVTE